MEGKGTQFHNDEKGGVVGDVTHFFSKRRSHSVLGSYCLGVTKFSGYC